MTNDATRAKFWSEFITSNSGYPASDRLRIQLTDAKFTEFCQCGCNSFAVAVSEAAKGTPLALPGAGYGAIYDADFRLPDGRTLEIILFADDGGNLVFVEVDCCANSYAVPDVIDIEEPPFRNRASSRLLM